jgi:hypothetical protein
MAAFDGINPFSHDDRLWRIRGWLLERTIFVLSGDPRWALIGFGGRVVTLLAVKTRIWVASVTRRDCC